MSTVRNTRRQAPPPTEVRRPSPKIRAATAAVVVGLVLTAAGADAFVFPGGNGGAGGGGGLGLVFDAVADAATDFVTARLAPLLGSLFPLPPALSAVFAGGARLFLASRRTPSPSWADGDSLSTAAGGGREIYFYDVHGMNVNDTNDTYHRYSWNVVEVPNEKKKFPEPDIFHLAPANSTEETGEQEELVSFEDQARKFMSRWWNRAVCYDYYGCFNLESPWFDPPRRVIELAPRTPDQVRPRFYLYTRTNTAQRQEIWDDVRVVTDSAFRATRPTKIIIFGHGDFPLAPWILTMKDALLQREDVNVIVVDWHPSYFRLQSRADSRLAGAMTAMFLKFLNERFAMTYASVHLIGQGSGAHLASYVGQSVKSPEPFSNAVVGRLTALDPFDVGFTETDPLVRVDPSDAIFVDVIHTDANAGKEGLGSPQVMGHVDFYPNGGKPTQPGCDLNFWEAWNQAGGSLTEAFRKYFYCGSFRAVDYFTESILISATAPATTCQFRSVACDNWNSFIGGTCALTCPAAGAASDPRCIRMGYNAVADFVPGTHSGLSFYLRTGDAEPFCRFQYYVSVRIGELINRRAKRGISTYLSRRVGQMAENILHRRLQTTRGRVTSGANDTRDIYDPRGYWKKAAGTVDTKGKAFGGLLSRAIVGDMYVAFRDSRGKFIGSTFKLNSRDLKVYFNTRVTGLINEATPLPVKADNANQLDGEIHMTFVPYFDFNQRVIVPDITLTSVETSKSFKMCSDGVIGGRKWFVTPIVFKNC